MKFLPGAKVFERVMIHTVGHHRGLGTTARPPLCFEVHLLVIKCQCSQVHLGQMALVRVNPFVPKEFYL